MEFLSNYFKFKEKETNLKSETIGGITTFLTMAYALFLIPSVLAEAGMPQGSVFVATGLAAALGTLIMGIFANFPMGLAPGVGLNAFFAYSVCLGMGIKWEVALSGVLASGIIFLIISATGLREMIIKLEQVVETEDMLRDLNNKINFAFSNIYFQIFVYIII